MALVIDRSVVRCVEMKSVLISRLVAVDGRAGE